MFFIQKIRKNSRTIVIILVSIFIGVSVLGILVGVINNISTSSESKKASLSIYSKDISRNEIFKVLNNSQNSYRDFGKILSLSHFIDREILLANAKKLHIFVTNKEIADEYSKKIEHARSKITQRITEKDLIRMFYKMSPYALKQSITNDILVKKVEEKVYEMYNPSKEDIDRESNLGISVEEATTSLKKKNRDKFFRGWLERERDKVELKDSAIDKYLDLKAISSNDLYISNVEFANMFLLYLRFPMILQGAKGSNNEIKAFSLVSKKMKEDLVLANEALKREIYVDPSFSMKDKINDLKNLLEKQEEESINILDRDVKKHFNANKGSYREKERAYANVVFFKYAPSEDDRNILIEKSDELLDRAIESNNLPKGFEIKKMSKKDFSRKYGRSYFKDGVVVPSLIKDGETLILAKANSNEISYIEMNKEISNKTKESIKERAEKTFKAIEEDKMDIKKAMDIYSDINFKKEQGPINKDSDLNKTLSGNLFKKEFGIEYKDEGIYIFKRTKYYEAKEPILKDLEGRVRSDLQKSMKSNHMSNLLNKLYKDYEIKYDNIDLKKMFKKAKDESAI